MKKTLLASVLAGALLTPATLLAERVEVGQQVPAVELESSSGESFDLQALSGEKKALLVFYRGTW